MIELETTFAGAALERDLRTFCRQASAGTAITPERRLAQRYGISLATVRRVMERLMEDQLILREQGRGTFIADRPANAVRALIYADSWGESEHPFYVTRLRGIVEAAGECNFRVEVHACDRHLAFDDRFRAELARAEVVGVIVPWATRQVVTAIHAVNPAVRLVATASPTAALGASSVGVDFTAVGTGGAHYLLDRGARQPLAICLHRDSGNGFLAACGEGRLDAQVRALTLADDLATLLPRWLAETGADGLAFDDDVIARRAETVLAAAAATMPRVSLANRSGELPPAFARLEVDGAQVGRMIVRTVSQMLDDPEHTFSVLLKPILIPAVEP